MCPYIIYTLYLWNLINMKFLTWACDWLVNLLTLSTNNNNILKFRKSVWSYNYKKIINIIKNKSWLLGRYEKKLRIVFQSNFHN